MLIFHEWAWVMSLGQEVDDPLASREALRGFDFEATQALLHGVGPFRQVLGRHCTLLGVCLVLLGDFVDLLQADARPVAGRKPVRWRGW